MCGRVCTHPCESDCKRKDVDEPLAIAQLKRFVADQENETGETVRAAELTKEKVAIVGAGPAGLSCAYFLAKRGYRPTVFEVTENPGGLLYWAIPRFRLPEKALQRDLDYIKSSGVEIKLNKELGKDFTIRDLFAQNHKAVFLGLGAIKEKSMGIEGEDLEGVCLCVEFLKKAVHNPKTPVGKKVAVVGGGNSAIDAVRTAVRLGAEEVFIVYRRSRREMPANEEEIIEAEKEGVKIHYLTNPTKILGKDGKVMGMECVKMELGEPDSSGRRRPIPVKGSEYIIDLDMVIMAIGQAADVEFLSTQENFEVTSWGTFKVDPDTLETSIKGVFAGGDVVTGPATVIEAIAAGKKAAESIDRFISGVDLKSNREKKRDRINDEEIKIPEDTKIIARTEMPVIDLERAKTSYEEVALGFTEEQARSEAQRCLSCAGCSECLECIKVCEPDAIDHDMRNDFIDLDIGSIIVATGVDYLDPKEASEYGYKRYRNIYTSLEIERIMSEDGPTHGKVPLDKELKRPLRFAFIQCVGSRNMKADIDYCSRICCMNAIKDTLVVREHYPESEIYMFYIDIRAFGKGFEEYYRRSLDAGVKFIKGKPSKIIEDKTTGELLLAYEDQLRGEIKSMNVDVAVLSSAMIPSHGSQELARVLGIELDQDGFFKERESCSQPMEATKEGVYLCGCATAPKDITDSIAEACGAAAKAGVLLKDAPVEIKEEEIIPLDLQGTPRVGVFICHCGQNISAVVSIETLKEYAAKLPNVYFAEDFSFACAETVQKTIQEAIFEHKLNRIVVAACTPKTHESTFQETLTKVGFNPYLFDIANIRNQCSWVHQKEPEKATEKAKDIIRMSVARVCALESLQPKILKVGRDILVIGGGIAGIQSAIDVANRGFKVYLVEKEKELGGRVAKLASVYPSGKPGRELIEEKIKELNKKNVKIMTDTEIKDIRGYVGNFEVDVISKGEKKLLNIGAIILSIGSELYKPLDKFGYGEYPNVYTSMELENMFISRSDKLEDLKSVAFIQCVGSRAEVGNTWCSRYCCQSAIKQAIELRKRNIDVTIFHRGIRVYSKGTEPMYRKAREQGVLFIPYSELAKGEQPEIIGSDKAEQIEMDFEPINGRVVVPVDAVFLSVGMVPNAQETTKLSELLKVPKGPDMFFLERHSKFGPVETTVEGVFLAGCCQFPQDIGDSISQASAVASKATSLLSRDVIILPPIVSSVDELLCRGCGKCAEVCEFHAITISEKESKIFVAQVNEALCKGCGTCVPACPTGAIDLRHFKIEQIKAQLEALFS